MKSFYVALVNAIDCRSLIVDFFFFDTITVWDNAHEFGLIYSCFMIPVSKSLAVRCWQPAVENQRFSAGFLSNLQRQLPKDFKNCVKLKIILLKALFDEGIKNI